MKFRLSVFLIVTIMGIIFYYGQAGTTEPPASIEKASIEKGKALFNDPKLGGSTNKESCNSCHPAGEGLEKACGKKSFMEGKVHSLDQMVNTCTKMTLKGTPPLSDQDLKDMVAYICSIKKK